VVQDEEDGQVAEQHAGFPAQQAAQPVPVQGIGLRVHEDQPGPVPGLGGQGLERVRNGLDPVPRTLEGRAEGFNQGLVAGDG